MPARTDAEVVELVGARAGDLHGVEVPGAAQGGAVARGRAVDAEGRHGEGRAVHVGHGVAALGVVHRAAARHRPARRVARQRRPRLGCCEG